ncbi:MAG: hypothetical protein J2P15_24630, partial [Micromonosporaceae bacterium]|nr:hypothetical protein [Micromonosporaceae bacterium]
ADRADHGWAGVRGPGHRAAGVVLVGPPGVGRTRLAREALDRLSPSGCQTAWATGTRSTASIPLGALAHLLPEPAPVAPLGALAGFAARFAGPSAGPSAGPRPVLVVDDVHLLDDASAALVHHVATQGYAFVLLTALAGAPAPDAVTTLWTGELVQRVDLADLDEQDAARLVSTVLGGRLDPVSQRIFALRCGGNPRLLREVLHAGLETGALRKQFELWGWTDASYLTARLTDVVRLRIGPLEPELRAVVEVLACAQPVELRLLEAVVEAPAIAEAERRGLLVVAHTGTHASGRVAGTRVTAQLPDQVHADVVRAEMPRSREREVLRRLVAALHDARRNNDRYPDTPQWTDDDALLDAAWRVRAGLPVPAGALLAAARHARSRFRLDLAERLAIEAGVAAGAASQATGAGEAELLRAELLVARGRYADAAALLSTVDGNTSRWVRVRHQVRYFTGAGGPVPAGVAGPWYGCAGFLRLIVRGEPGRAEQLASARYHRAIGRVTG